MNTKSFSAINRRDLLKVGGALVVGFGINPLSYSQNSNSRTSTSKTPAAGPPDAQSIDSWIAIHADNTATIYIGFAELGQGCSTALLQVAAEELDLGMDQVSSVGLDTHITPNQGGTYSSSAIARGGPQVQQAAAQARVALLNLAAKKLEMDVNALAVERGLIKNADGKKSITYGELIGDQLFDLRFTGTAPVKSSQQFRLVGKGLSRKDTPLKAKGTYQYIQHLRLPNMLHGRIVRPRGQGAYGHGIQIKSVDEKSIAHISGVKVLRKSNFIGVVAEREWDAVRAANELKVEWLQPESLPGSDKLFAHMENNNTTDITTKELGDVNMFASADIKCEFSGNSPYQAHVPFAPNCALADAKKDSALVMSSTQDVYGTRRSIANLLGLTEQQVRVQYHESSGTFGHSCWDDAAQAAALMSQLSEKPVRVQFMRWDEHGWDTYGPAHVGKAKASASKDGKILSFEYEGWQHHWSLIETTEQISKGTPASEWPAFPAQQINPLVLGGQYKIPNVKLLNHHVDGLQYLKGAWLRSPLDLNCAFVAEQAIDDLAFQLKQDPLEFRRNNILDERWLGVLEGAAKGANWQTRAAAQSLSKENIVRGRGIGLGTHLASWGGAVAEIEVNKSSGEIKVLHLCGAIDAGLVVNPSNVENQIIGQLVQTASRMLLEEVTFNKTNVTSLDWASYPILRIKDAPRITPVIVQRLNEKPFGAGEEVMAAAAAAIANAFFDATGKRMHTYPMTPERVKAALGNV